MTEQATTGQSGSPFFRAVGGFFKVLLRLIAVIVIGGLVGLGLYYGVPWVYGNLVRPVQQNTVSIISLEQRFDQEQDRLQDENLELQERVADMEAAMTQLREDVSVSSQELADLQAQVQTLDGRLADAEKALGEQEGALAALQQDLEDASADTAADYALLQDATLVLKEQMALTQVAQDLLKVRLMLLEDNTRAAQDALALAVEHLDRAVAGSPDLEVPLADVRERMVALDALIAARSFRVAPDLEALWADVMDLVLPPVALEAESVVEVAEEAVTEETVTPTPTPVVTPTPTPTSAS